MMIIQRDRSGRSCRTLSSAIDVWVVETYAGCAEPDEKLAAHLVVCPECRRRAAMGWLLLPDTVCAQVQTIPVPNLSFLHDGSRIP